MRRARLACDGGSARVRAPEGFANAGVGPKHSTTWHRFVSIAFSLFLSKSGPIGRKKKVGSAALVSLLEP